DRPAREPRRNPPLMDSGHLGRANQSVPLPHHPAHRAPGRAAAADPDRSVGVRHRGDSTHHLRVWIPRGRRNAAPQLDLRPPTDGSTLGRRNGHLHVPVSVKNRLRVLRAELDWSQADLAEHLGVSRQTVNAIETGKYDPSLPLAFSLARTFKRPIEEIFDSEESRADVRS